MSTEVRPTAVRVGQVRADHSRRRRYEVIAGPRDDGRFQIRWASDRFEEWCLPTYIIPDGIVGMVDAPAEVPPDCEAPAGKPSHRPLMPAAPTEAEIEVRMRERDAMRMPMAFTADVVPARYQQIERPAWYPEIEPLHWLEDV